MVPSKLMPKLRFISVDVSGLSGLHSLLIQGRHDTQHNDTQHNYIMRNYIIRNNIQHNETQYNNTQYNGIQHNNK
jgi:hypothetical protein